MTWLVFQSSVIESLQQTGLDHLCDIYLKNLENATNTSGTEQIDEVCEQMILFNFIRMCTCVLMGSKLKSVLFTTLQ